MIADKDHPGADAAQNSKRYNTVKLTTGVGETILGWVFLLIIVYAGFSRMAERWAESVASNQYLALLLFAAVVGIAELIVTLPVSFYRGYILEHEYELSSHTLASYWWERAKAVFVALLLGVPALLVLYYFLSTYPEIWWVPVGVFIFVLTVILGRVAPVLIFPLFYKFVPLADEELEAVIRNRCKSCGMKVEGVFQFDLSKTTKKANAAFAGMGKSKRILLGDNLVNEFPVEEIEAVLAHELGHFVKKHIWKMIALGTLLTFLGLYLVSLVYSQWWSSLGYESAKDLAALPLLALLLGIYGFVTGPIQNGVSRRFERNADRFARDMLDGDGAPLSAALERLAELNLADRDPHPVVEFLFHSHPSVKRRIAYLGT